MCNSHARCSPKELGRRRQGITIKCPCSDSELVPTGMSSLSETPDAFVSYTRDALISSKEVLLQQVRWSVVVVG